MLKQFDVEILHHILNHFSENLTRDCSRIIENLLKSLSFQDKKAFAAIEVLLTLCEKVQEEDKPEEVEVPIQLIIQSIQHVLQCGADNCQLPDNDVQNNILSIISLLFRNSQNNLQSLGELVKVYDHTLTCMYNRGDNKECKTDCLLFKLKIVNSVYYALNTYTPSNVKLHDRLKSVNNLDECKLFGDFVLYENDEIAIQTLMYLIPEYINCFKSYKIVEIIWRMISNSMTDPGVNYSRVLIILCKIFEISFENSTFKDNKDLIRLLLEDSNYWKLIQMCVIEEDPLKKKQGMYLLEKSIDVLNSTCFDILCCKEREIFFSWDVSCKDELYKIYSEIIIILQFLDEQQVHIIKPVFGMIETLVKKIIQCGTVSFSWILLVYKKALMHESTQIVKWGLSSLLKLSDDFFKQEYVTKETVGLIVSTLNSMNLYYTDREVVTEELPRFYSRISDLSVSKTFFSLLIKCLCRQVWSAETLFFVTHSLSEFLTERHKRFAFWGREEISEIKEFVSKAFKTHNKIIRTAVQCELLKVVSYMTDREDVPLENLILLISRFSVGEILPWDFTWDTFSSWLAEAYPLEEFRNVIKKYKRGELDKEFNEKCMALLIISEDWASVRSLHPPDASVGNDYFHEMLFSFREIDKRLYCDGALQDQYLSIIVHIFEANEKVSGFIKSTVPFVRDIVLYIQRQLQEISGLQDYNACHFYLNAFEYIMKTLTVFKADTDVCEELIRDLEEACSTSDNSCIATYYNMKLFSIMLDLCPVKLKSNSWGSYLVAEVNKPLKKDSDILTQTRDIQTLWGRMNSEFLEGKWKILECLTNRGVIIYESLKIEGTVCVSDNDLVKLCLDALCTGGYGVLCPVMSILKELIPVLKNISEVRRIVELVWKIISERRKTEEFKLFIKRFVEMLFQEAFILKGDSALELLLEYTDLIFSDSSLTVINIFIKHIQLINLPDISVTLFCHAIGKGLLFGPIQKKDEKLTNAVCHKIESLKICEARKIGDFSLSQEIRARAVQKILMLDKNIETHKTAARNLIDTLIKMESEINKNRVRYFADSHTHRVKHRLMQALLLLEPMLDVNEKQAAELLRWLSDCIMNENSQPSVRYMQEWLIVRMLVRHSQIHSPCSQLFYAVDVSKKSLCSTMAIVFHLSRLSSVPSDMERRISNELLKILFYCFHQHFEVRLYAQIVFRKLYKVAKNRNCHGIIKGFEKIDESLTLVHDMFFNTTKGNFKNLFKLVDDFYLSTFEPLEHYSLDTIYTDLPRLTNAGLDERISTETFKYCGVDSYNMSVPLRSENNSLKVENASERCLKFNSDMSTLPVELKSEENYQKKIIPRKPLIPVWDENDSDQQSTSRKNGLIVVASLIDRIPNLGGLARTCEIFGASEYVVGSLRYTEDKQFTSLSVTAEKWIPVKEVKTQNLLTYVLEMKQNGYTVIGAEQALHSVPLKEVKFPKKSLLLLGNEKEGIPPNLLPLLDVCVEIPQVGIIRSLNVHVTGALFIWEYAKQNLL